MSTDSVRSAGNVAEFGPFGSIPRLTARQVLDETLIAHAGGRTRFGDAFCWLGEVLGTGLAVGHPEIFWRAAGRGRPGAVAHIAWPERRTRLAFGIENTLAHAIVDRLLGYERFAGEERLQITPVEWGILTFAAARSLVALGEPRGLILDRVGPEPIVVDDLGPIVTLRWSVQIGPHVGSARLWVPEALLKSELSGLAVASESDRDRAVLFDRFKSLGASWRAVAGTVTCLDGIGPDLLRAVLPIDHTELTGTAAAPAGPVDLITDGFRLPAQFGLSGGEPRVIIQGPLTTAENLAMSPPSDASPMDVPVTLTVELGKIQIPLEELADLRPGQTLSLLRHAREPVELTSSGRLVARGELVQIDDVLGVRILNVLL